MPVWSGVGGAPPRRGTTPLRGATPSGGRRVPGGRQEAAWGGQPGRRTGAGQCWADLDVPRESSRDILKPCPVTWLQHSMPSSEEVQAKELFFAAEPYWSWAPELEKEPPQLLVALPSFLTVQVTGEFAEFLQEASVGVKLCSLMVQVTESSPRLQVMFPRGAV